VTDAAHATSAVDGLRPLRPLSWVKGYSFEKFRPDLLAGLTVTAICVPESLGYAGIVGLPPQTGLYCALFPAIIYALMASSPQLVVGADSATASLVAAGAVAVTGTSSAEYPGVVALLVLMAGLALAAMSLARLGFLADLIGRPVLTGFLSGIGVYLIITKLGAVLGLKVSGSPLDQLVKVAKEIGSANWWCAALGALTIVIYLVFERLLPKLPAALVAIVAASLVAGLIDASAHGVAAVGAVPAGLPSFRLPNVALADVVRLLGASAGVAFVVLAQSAAVSRSFAGKYEQRVDTNIDLLGLGAANAVSALSGGFAINGSPPRTAASDGAGGRTPVVNLVMALCIGLILLFLTGLFEYLPAVVLDALVMGIGIRLIAVGELEKIYRARRSEFAVSILALLVVALVGVEQGLVVAVVLALGDRLRRQYHPHDEVYVLDGQVEPKFQRRFPRVLDGLDGVLVYRFSSSLFFENSDYFDTRVRTLLAQFKGPVRTVVLDARAIADIDYTAGQMLTRLRADLHDKGCDLVFTEGAAELRAALQAEGLGDVQFTDDLEDTVLALRSL